MQRSNSINLYHESNCHYLCYLLQIISSSISYVITKHNTLSTTPTMSYHHLHHHVAKGRITLVYHIFSGKKHRYCSFLFMLQINLVKEPLQQNFNSIIFLLIPEFVPFHQAEAEKMHANQIEETDELTLCDQLHEQLAVSSFPKTPMI